MIALGLALSSLLAGEPQWYEDRLPLVTISVEAMPEATIAHTIEIVAQRDHTARDREEWARNYQWTATRTSERGTDRVTSEDCPQLRSQAIVFQQLPPIEPSTPATVVQNERLPIDVIALSGFSTTLRFRTFAGATVSISGSESYGLWGSQTVSTLLECWPALVP